MQLHAVLGAKEFARKLGQRLNTERARRAGETTEGVRRRASLEAEQARQRRLTLGRAGEGSTDSEAGPASPAGLDAAELKTLLRTSSTELVALKATHGAMQAELALATDRADGQTAALAVLAADAARYKRRVAELERLFPELRRSVTEWQAFDATKEKGDLEPPTPAATRKALNAQAGGQPSPSAAAAGVLAMAGEQPHGLMHLAPPGRQRRPLPVQVNRTTTDRSSDRNRGGRDTAVRYGDVTAAAEQELYMAQERVKKVARLDEARAQAKAQKAAREAAEREVEELQVHPIARRVGF